MAVDRKLRILVIDDEAIVRTVITKAFKFSQIYEILEADTGPSGLEKARTLHPDLIILDWILPGMDGIEILKEIRSDSALKNVPIIMLTGRGTIEDKIAGLYKGANEYIIKPFDVRELIAHTERLLAPHDGDGQSCCNEGAAGRDSAAFRQWDNETAASLRQRFISARLPEIENIAFAAYLTPSSESGGDFYDIFSPDGKEWLLCLGTVAQKGSAAAYAARAICSFIRYCAAGERSPSAVTGSLDRFLCCYGEDVLLPSFCLCTVQPRESAVRIAWRGSIKPMLIRHNHGAMMLESCCDAEGEQKITLDTGDLLCLSSISVNPERLESLQQGKEMQNPGTLAAELSSLLADETHRQQDSTCILIGRR